MPKVEWLKGVFPAIITPFDKNENIDEKALRGLINFLIKDVNGFVVNGTTGEFNYLSPAENKKVLDIVLDEVKGKVKVIAGTGASSTKEAIELTLYAKEKKADAVINVTPYYFKPTFKEIYDHYEKLNEIGIPIIVYNIPQCAGVHMRWWTGEALAYMSNVIGLKDSSGDMAFFMALIEKIYGKISILCGHDEIGMPALSAGADGVILASANLIPDIWQKIYKAVQNKNMDEARELQRSIQILVRTLVNSGANQGVKEGLRMMGLEAGNSRKPIMTSDIFRREDIGELRAELEKLGKISKKKVKFELNNEVKFEASYPAIPETPEIITNFIMKTSEAYCEPPSSEVAHIDMLLGLKNGPVDYAVKKALSEPKEQRAGREVELICEKPQTLLVPTVTIRTKKQQEQVFVQAKSGILKAIDKSIEDGILPKEILDKIVILINVFVHPSASIKRRIEINNYKAMRHALRKAIEDKPSVEELLYEKESARHPLRYSP